MIHDLKNQGLTISAIARKLGCDRKTVRRHLERGMEVPVYKPRPPQSRLLEEFEPYLSGRVCEYPDLTGSRLLREIRAMGYSGSYTLVTNFLREIRPPSRTQFERRFETPPGKQAQVDFAEFSVEFTPSQRCTHRLPGNGRARRNAQGLVIFHGAGPLALALGPVLLQPESAIGDAMSYRCL